MPNYTLPEGLTTIGNSAFEGCSNLTSVTIPDSVTTIGSSAFRDCSRLKTVYYAGTAEEWANIEIYNTENRNSYLINATKYYYSETEPIEEGKFWHYVDGEIAIW